MAEAERLELAHAAGDPNLRAWTLGVGADALASARLSHLERELLQIEAEILDREQSGGTRDQLRFELEQLGGLVLLWLERLEESP